MNDDRNDGMTDNDIPRQSARSPAFDRIRSLFKPPGVNPSSTNLCLINGCWSVYRLTSTTPCTRSACSARDTLVACFTDEHRSFLRLRRWS